MISALKIYSCGAISRERSLASIDQSLNRVKILFCSRGLLFLQKPICSVLPEDIQSGSKTLELQAAAMWNCRASAQQSGDVFGDHAPMSRPQRLKCQSGDVFGDHARMPRPHSHSCAAISVHGFMHFIPV